MRNLITTMAVLALMGSPGAMAQTGTNTGSPGAANPAPAREAPVGPNYLSDANSLSQTREPRPELRYRVVDYCGDVHLYPPEP